MGNMSTVDYHCSRDNVQKFPDEWMRCAQLSGLFAVVASLALLSRLHWIWKRLNRNERARIYLLYHHDHV